MHKLRSIQVLRAVAASGVVFLHAYLVSGQPRPSAIQLGAAGVDLFFVISGFILATISVGRRPGEFIADRCWRIYPLWWLATLPQLIRYGFSPSQLATSATLWPIWGGSYTYPLPELGWTLGFEMLFYLSITLKLKTRASVPLALFATCAIVAQFLPVPLLTFFGNPMALEFLGGACIARMPRVSRFGGLFGALGIAGLTLAPLHVFSMYVAIDPHAAFTRALLWGAPAAALVYGCVCMEKEFARKAFNFLVLLGDASYSIYVFHLTIMGALPLRLHWVLLALISILGGLVIHLSLERRIPELRKAYRAWKFRRDQAQLA